jgi:hypothetical protein
MQLLCIYQTVSTSAAWMVVLKGHQMADVMVDLMGRCLDLKGSMLADCLADCLADQKVELKVDT